MPCLLPQQPMDRLTAVHMVTGHLATPRAATDLRETTILMADLVPRTVVLLVGPTQWLAVQVSVTVPSLASLWLSGTIVFK